MTKYILISHKTGAVFNDAEGKPAQFADMASAQAEAVAMNRKAVGAELGALLEDSNNNVQPTHHWVASAVQPVDLDWRERERNRVAGEYTRLMPELEAVCVPDHFAHVAKGAYNAIAYTKDEVGGLANIRKRMRISAYLEKFAPQLTAAERADLETRQTEGAAAGELQWAETADDIETAYTHYDSEQYALEVSCMRHAADVFRSRPLHPTAVYGDSDLMLAYTVDGDDCTTARCLVDKAKKVYSRMYGGDRSLNVLVKLLRTAGYKPSYGYYGCADENPDRLSLVGSRIRAIPASSRDPGMYVMPYVDEASWGILSADGQWFELSMASSELPRISLKETGGTARLRGKACGCCGKESAGERDTSPVTGVLRNYRADGAYQVEDYAQLCAACADPNSTSTRIYTCTGTGLRFMRSGVDYVTIGGKTYAEPWAYDHKVRCNQCGNFADELVGVLILPQGWRDVTGRRVDEGVYTRVCASCLKKAFWCVATEQLVHSNLMLELADAPRKRIGGALVPRGVSVLALDPAIVSQSSNDLADRHPGIAEAIAAERAGEPVFTLRRPSGRAARTGMAAVQESALVKLLSRASWRVQTLRIAVADPTDREFTITQSSYVVVSDLGPSGRMVGQVVACEDHEEQQFLVQLPNGDREWFPLERLTADRRTLMSGDGYTAFCLEWRECAVWMETRVREDGTPTIGVGSRVMARGSDSVLGNGVWVVGSADQGVVILRGTASYDGEEIRRRISLNDSYLRALQWSVPTPTPANSEELDNLTTRSAAE